MRVGGTGKLCVKVNYRVGGGNATTRRLGWTFGKVSKVQHTPEVQETLQKCSERAIKRLFRLFSEGFSGDFHALSTRLEARLDFANGPRSNPPLQEGRFDHAKGPRSNHPL